LKVLLTKRQFNS